MENFRFETEILISFAQKRKTEEKRHAVEFVTVYESCVKGQSNFSHCGLKNNDFNTGDPGFIFKYEKKETIFDKPVCIGFTNTKVQIYICMKSIMMNYNPINEQKNYIIRTLVYLFIAIYLKEDQRMVIRRLHKKCFFLHFLYTRELSETFFDIKENLLG